MDVWFKKEGKEHQRKEYFERAIAKGFKTWPPLNGHEYLPKKEEKVVEEAKQPAKQKLKVKKTIVKPVKYMGELMGRNRRTITNMG